MRPRMMARGRSIRSLSGRRSGRHIGQETSSSLWRSLANMARISASKQSPITASMLYNLVSCPHRVAMDLFTDPAERDEVSPFLRLLWERGTAHEKNIV